MNRYTVRVATYTDCPIEAANDELACVIARNMVQLGHVPQGSTHVHSEVQSVQDQDGLYLLVNEPGV